MGKRLLLGMLVAIFAGSIFMLGLGGRAVAQTAPDIQCSLWAGVNFDLSPDCDQQSSSNQTSRSHTTQRNSNRNATYAALGDSVAGGLGLPGAADQDTRCNRSVEAYPYRVAEARGLQPNNIACSGATVGDLFTRQGINGPNIPPQLDTAFANGTPALITITAGANDVHWADFLRLCYSSNCATDSSSAVASGYLTLLQLKLRYALSDIQNRSNGNPPLVILTGYYNPVSNQCRGQISQITDEEIQWLNGQRSALNQTIRDTANEYSFARYASINFSGHTICSADPWVQGLQDTAPFHPTIRGQQHVAESVLKAIGS